MMAAAKTHFLIVDDDTIDVMVIKRILSRIDESFPYTVANDGVEGIEALSDLRDRLEDFRGLIVLLDLNMPRMNGEEVLEKVRNDARIKDATVFLLSTSDDPRDMQIGEQYGVAGYIPKRNLQVDYLKEMLTEYLYRSEEKAASS